MSEGLHAEFGNEHMLRFIRPRHKAGVSFQRIGFGSFFLVWMKPIK